MRRRGLPFPARRCDSDTARTDNSNRANGLAATVAGGGLNDALGANSTVSGGYDKLARDLSSVGGGTGNIASGVAGLDPRLVTRNARGDVEGVKYERLSVLLVGSVQELAERDRLQSAELAEWRRRLERLEARAAR